VKLARKPKAAAGTTETANVTGSVPQVTTKVSNGAKTCAVCNKEVKQTMNFANGYLCYHCIYKLAGTDNIMDINTDLVAGFKVKGYDYRKLLVEDVVKFYEEGKHEVMKKCNVCGNVFCYTHRDLKRNRKLANGSLLTSVGGLAGAVSGNHTMAAVQQGNAANSTNRIVDYNKCPKCNSTDLRTLNKGEFQREQKSANAPQVSAVSTADELKKFKDLLDSGVITQEEFDEKKKQLLGL
jgi:hypothetical protein